MGASPAFREFVCVDCGHGTESLAATSCERCDGRLLATYDLGSAALVNETHQPSCWAYADLLPVAGPVGPHLHPGGTPIVACPDVAERLDLGTLSVIDEGRNPTGSWADRAAGVAVSSAAITDTPRVALPSTGDDAQAVAAAAAPLGIETVAHVPSRTGFVRKAMINVHGADMRVIGGRYPAAVTAHREALDADTLDVGPPMPHRVEAAKTVAFDAIRLAPTTPSAIVCPAATGELLVGLVRGSSQASEMGLVDRPPTVYAVQPSGCAPIADALRSGESKITAVGTPDTIVGELEIPEPPLGAAAIEAVRRSGGGGATVTDEASFSAGVALASRAGIEVGLAGGTAAAGVEALVEAGRLGSDSDVLVVNTGAGNKDADLLRSHLMGRGM